MLALVELKATYLEGGIPGISPLHMLLIFMLALWGPMIPYFFLYLSLRDKEGKPSRASHALEFLAQPFGKMAGWIQAHRHPLLHH